MRVEMERSTPGAGAQAAASLAALKASQQRDETPGLYSSSVVRDGSAWDPSSRTPLHPSNVGGAITRYDGYSGSARDPSSMTPRHNEDPVMRDGGAWDPSASTPLHPSSLAGGLTPRYDQYSEVQDGSAWDPRSSTPLHPSNLAEAATPRHDLLASSGTPIPASSTGAGTGSSSAHWLASRVLYEALRGLDIVVKNSRSGLLEQRVYLSTLGGLVVAREGKRTTRLKEGNLIPFNDIEQSLVVDNPEKARKLYIVIRGLNVGRIGRCVGKWVNTAQQYDYRLVPVQIQLGSGIKWGSKLEEGGAEFIASRYDLAAIHEPAPQILIGNNQVDKIRLKNAGKSW